MIKKILAVICISALSGCANQSLYNWGRYDQSLYDYYKSPATEVEFRTSLENHLSATTASGKKPPPGLLAELGTLYLKAGDTSNAKKYYQLEAKTWPESQKLMQVLITNIDAPTDGGKK